MRVVGVVLCFGWGTDGAGSLWGLAFGGFGGKARRGATHASVRFAGDCPRHKEVAGNCGQIDEARARFFETMIMSALPSMLLVVTLRATWFNFRGWKKRP
jgi:hypothetical protein